MNHREQLLTEGFTVFRNLFDKAFIDGLRDGLSKRIGEQEREFATISMDNRPEYFELYTHPVVLRVLKDELKCPDSKYWSSYFINKNPGESRRPWHHDWAWWNERLSKQYFGPQLGFMIYFTPTNEFNGCLEVVPGSHKVWWMDDYKVHQDWFNKHPRGRSVVSNPGDLVVVDARTLHATEANTSQEPRMMCTMWYYTNWRELSEQYRAHKAIRDEGFAMFGDLWPTCDLPYLEEKDMGEYKMKHHPTREDMI